MTPSTDATPTNMNTGMSYNPKNVSFAGTLIDAGHADFDAARTIHNGLIDKRPAYIVQCENTQDVVHAIDMARQLNLEISVRGGGHNVGGRAVTDGGVMIDFSRMRTVTVNAAEKTATAQAGASWADFNNATHEFGLAVTGGAVSSTGVAGLTLGGGLGWLMALYGMAVDNLLSAEIVTADGQVLTVNETENTELFWAVRGGGGNFGVVTSFTFQLHPIGEVLGGLVVHPFDRAREVLHFYRTTTSNAPDELTLFAGLLHAPDGSGNKISAMVGFHSDATAGVAVLAPVRAFGPPMMDAFAPMPYKQLNMMLDGGFPRGALNYWKSSFIEALTDEAIDTMIAAFKKCPSAMTSMLLEHFHGAVTRIHVSATAYPHRATGYNLLIASQWMDPSETEANKQWTRETYDAMKPFMSKSRFMNYLGDDEPSDAVARAYGANYERLQRAKTQYDPKNMFHLNQNIKPL